MSDKELLFSVTKKDFEVQFFCAGGPGGQHQNKTSSACRIVHPASGAIGESREEREQSRNKKIAFNRLVNSKTFQSWLRLRSAEAMMDGTVEDKVNEAMSDSNVRTEIKVNGKWVIINNSGLGVLKDD